MIAVGDILQARVLIYSVWDLALQSEYWSGWSQPWSPEVSISIRSNQSRRDLQNNFQLLLCQCMALLVGRMINLANGLAWLQMYCQALHMFFVYNIHVSKLQYSEIFKADFTISHILIMLPFTISRFCCQSCCSPQTACYSISWQHTGTLLSF